MIDLRVHHTFRVSIDRVEDSWKDLKRKTISRFLLQSKAAGSETGKYKCSKVLCQDAEITHY
ncbi:TPA: hypothetical protein DIT45_04740 [Candidatus Acetothermia bacterium]|nr:hypothetical protein [Candidatus Acetothermia bacterium]